jgi:hypothetical protein
MTGIRKRRKNRMSKKQRGFLGSRHS